MQKLLAPKVSYRWAKACQPWFAAICILSMIYGLTSGLIFAPADYQQGNVFRIIYIHVPAATMSMLVYACMAVAVIVNMVWKVKVADMYAKVAAPIGAIFTLLALVTGSIWGRPTWGTYWVWDARLTSELILLFVYFGIMALRSAMPDLQRAAMASGVLTLVGVVNLPIIHYSVVWWNTLHQGATILKFGSPSISASMLHPLLVMLLAFFSYFLWMMAIKLRGEILLRETKTTWVQALRSRQ